MGMNTTQDPDIHPHWTEYLNFSFVDRRADICGVIVAHLRPADEWKYMSCSLMMPDRSVLWFSETTSQRRPTLESKKIRLEPRDPDRAWRLGFVGGMVRTSDRKERKSHVELDLEFVGVNDAFDHTGQRDTQGASSAGHPDPRRLEQFGRLDGTLSSGLEDFELHALGNRRHSRGAIDWSALMAWTWISCQFSEERAIGLLRTTSGDVTVDTGFVFDGGRNVSIEGADVTISRDMARNPQMFDLTVSGSDGVGRKVVATPVRRVVNPLEAPGAGEDLAMQEILAKFNLGGSTGYGVIEHLTRMP